MKRSITTLSVAALTAATAALPFAVSAHAATRAGDSTQAGKCCAKQSAKCGAKSGTRSGSKTGSKTGMCGART